MASWVEGTRCELAAYGYSRDGKSVTASLARPDPAPAQRAVANFAAADLDGLVRIVKCRLKKIEYRPT